MFRTRLIRSTRSQSKTDFPSVLPLLDFNSVISKFQYSKFFPSPVRPFVGPDDHSCALYACHKGTSSLATGQSCIIYYIRISSAPRPPRLAVSLACPRAQKIAFLGVWLPKTFVPVKPSTDTSRSAALDPNHVTGRTRTCLTGFRKWMPKTSSS